MQIFFWYKIRVEYTLYDKIRLCSTTKSTYLDLIAYDDKMVIYNIKYLQM